jgi:hypothetical protein
VATALATAALLYSQYWSLYLVAVTGAWLLWQAWRGPSHRRRNARFAFAAVLAGCAAFLPWVPTFLFQAHHTGTPWAAPGSLDATVHAIAEFAGGATSEGRALALVYFALTGLGLFGLAIDRKRIELDLLTRPRARGLAIVVAGTLLLAVGGGILTHSAYSDRYASVVLMPFILLVALGASTFADRKVRVGVLALAAAVGLLASLPDIWTNRTQAAEVSTTLARLGRPGDVVAYCPDQLGPSVNRLLPTGRYSEITFPRGTGPEFVDWIDYAKASKKGSPAAFARRLEAMSGGKHQIWLVWAPGYATFGTKCETIETNLLADRSLAAHEMFPLGTEYQPMELVRFVPSVSASQGP